MINKDSLTKEFQKLLCEFENCSNVIANNKELDFAVFEGLYSRVALLCSSVIGIEEKERKSFIELTNQLLKKSSELSITMSRQKKLIEDQINSINVSNKATKAYKTYAAK